MDDWWCWDVRLLRVVSSNSTVTTDPASDEPSSKKRKLTPTRTDEECQSPHASIITVSLCWEIVIERHRCFWKKKMTNWLESCCVAHFYPTVYASLPTTLHPTSTSHPLPRIVTPTLHQFMELQSRGCPFIITGGIEHWPAYSSSIRNWSDITYLKSIAGHRTIPVEVGTHYMDDSWTQTMISLVRGSAYESDAIRGWILTYTCLLWHYVYTHSPPSSINTFSLHHPHQVILHNIRYSHRYHRYVPISVFQIIVIPVRRRRWVLMLGLDRVVRLVRYTMIPIIIYWHRWSERNMYNYLHPISPTIWHHMRDWCVIPVVSMWRRLMVSIERCLRMRRRGLECWEVRVRFKRWM